MNTSTDLERCPGFPRTHGHDPQGVVRALGSPIAFGIQGHSALLSDIRAGPGPRAPAEPEVGGPPEIARVCVHPWPRSRRLQGGLHSTPTPSGGQTLREPKAEASKREQETARFLEMFPRDAHAAASVRGVCWDTEPGAWVAAEAPRHPPPAFGTPGRTGGLCRRAVPRTPQPRFSDN